MKNKEKKLGLWLLVFVGLGSMIGSGIFNSPKDLVGVSNPQGVMLTWLIGGFGALMLAFVFIYLALRKPNLKSGIYVYAKDGFGDYMGFNSAWGYWSLGWLGNVSYSLVFFKTLNDLLGEKALSPVTCFVLGSVILWFYFFVISAGVREGVVTNFIVTVAKIIPIALVIFVGFALIKIDVFNVPDWENTLASTGGQTTPAFQIRDAMAVVLWCFVGVEAASVMSGRAKNQQTVQRATLISVLTVLGIYMLLTFIAMASVPAKELWQSDTPLALVLEKTPFGMAGAIIVKVGIMVSVLGASLSWILLSVETMYAAAKDGVMPKALAKENKNGTPINALLTTQIFTQIFLLSILSPNMNRSYLAAITIATSLVLIPYFLSSLYAVKIALKQRRTENPVYIVVAFLGTVYSMYVIYAVGIRYLAFTVLFYALGVVLFVIAKRERKETVLWWEKMVMLLLVTGSIVLLYLLVSGKTAL